MGDVRRSRTGVARSCSRRTASAPPAGRASSARTNRRRTREPARAPADSATLEAPLDQVVHGLLRVRVLVERGARGVLEDNEDLALVAHGADGREAHAHQRRRARHGADTHFDVLWELHTFFLLVADMRNPPRGGFGYCFG